MEKVGCRGMGFRGTNKVFGAAPQFGSIQLPSPHPHRAGGLDHPKLEVAPGKFLLSPRSSCTPAPQPSQSQHESSRIRASAGLGAKAAQGNTRKFGSDAPSPSSSLEKEQDLPHWDTPAPPQATLPWVCHQPFQPCPPSRKEVHLPQEIN